MSSHKDTELYYTDRAQTMADEMPDYVRLYMRAIHNTTAPRTRYEYLKDIGNFLDYVSEFRGAAAVTMDDLIALRKTDFEAYLEYLEHYERGGREYTNDRVSVRRKLSALRKFFAWLFESELIPSDEIRKVSLPKPHKKEIIYLDSDETGELLDAVEYGGALTPKQRDYHNHQAVRDMAIVTLLLSTGIRVSECAELDLWDVDMKHSALHIVRKGGNESTVYFSDEAADYLQAWLDERAGLSGVPQDEYALFLSSRKQRLGVRSIEILVKKYAKRAVPLKHITPHKLRATFATGLYGETGDIYLVAETLGHKDVNTTKEHYAHLSEQRRENARNAVRLRPEPEEKS